jgi:hypothetical protein
VAHPELLEHPQRGGVVDEALGGDAVYFGTGAGRPDQARVASVANLRPR